MSQALCSRRVCRLASFCRTLDDSDLQQRQFSRRGHEHEESRTTHVIHLSSMPLCSLSVLKRLGSESLVSMRGVSCPKRVKSAPGWPLFRVQMTVFRASMFFAVRTPLRGPRAAAGGRHKTTSKDVHRRRATGRVQHCATSNARESKRGPILPTRADCSVGEPFLVFTRRPLPPRCLSESSASPQRRPQPPTLVHINSLHIASSSRGDKIQPRHALTL